MIQESIRAVLRADNTITATVGRRIRPLIAGPTDERPFLVYSTDIESIPTFGGKADFERATLSISSVGDTHDECRDLAAEVRRVLDGYSGTSEGVQIVPCLLTDESEIEQGVEAGTERPVYVRTQTYRALYREVS